MPIDPPIPPEPPRAPQGPSPESVACYRTVAGAELAAQAAAIERVLREVGDASAASFAVTADSRRLCYVDWGAIFQASAKGATDSSDRAENRARQCVQALNVALGRAGILAAMKAVSFVPEGLRLQSATPVYDPQTLQVDHWLCRFRLVVRASSSVPESEVTDGAIEVRISGAGQMVGLVAQWRPITQTILSSPVPPPDPRDLPWTAPSSERAGLGADGGTQPGAPRLIYALAESRTGESQLSPYYIFDADPLQRLYPASQASPGQPTDAAGA
ncbi:MAG TPA: hypothetical protein VH458_20000 [Vicinamibacterales bacterium]